MGTAHPITSAGLNFLKWFDSHDETNLSFLRH
jgi:hypothetical protein